MADPGRALFPCTFVQARDHARPGQEVPRGRKRPHVEADLSQDDLGRHQADARNRHQECAEVAKGDEDVCDPLVENFDALFQVFQHAEVLADQEAMIIGHVTFKRSNQFGTRALQTLRSERGQL
jgi:hypothetical protein